MFCPECGTQNDDTAKFCVRCGHPNPLAGSVAGTPVPQQVIVAAPASSGSKLPWVLGGLALLVIAGLVGFIVLRGSITSDQDAPPAPRARNTTNVSNATTNVATPAANSMASSSPASSSNVATSSNTSSQPAANLTAPPAPKAVKKPVDCDKKCYQVYDQCMADYRQNPDPESICRAKQQSCLVKCQ